MSVAEESSMRTASHSLAVDSEQPPVSGTAGPACMAWTTDTRKRVRAFSSVGQFPFTVPKDACDSLIEDIFPSDDLAKGISAAHDAALAGETRTFDASHAERLYRIHVAPRRDELGEIDGCLGFAQDLTAQRRAEEALRRSEARYRAISELTRTYAYSTRLEAGGSLGLEWVTGDFVQITEYTLDEIKTLGGPLTLVHPADRPIAVKRTERLLAGHSHVCEFRIVTKSGTTRWLRDYGRPVHDRHEKGTVRFYGTAQDITDRKQAEQALRESEERFRLAFEEGPLGMGVFNLAGTLLQVNHAMALFLGRTPRELAGQRLETIVAGEDVLSCMAVFRHVVAGYPSRPCIENRYLQKDGRLGWGRTTMTPLRDEEGGVMCVLAMVEDITDRKHTEEALRRTERLASIGTLAAGIAHEINNPLGAITLSVDAVSLSADQENREEIIALAMNNIRASALRCGRIVKSMVQFARHEATRKANGDLAEVARRARDMAHSFARRREIRLELDLDENLPPIRMNATEMTQVCVNLLFNAIDASPPDSEVILRLRATSGAVRMDVVDRGQGIPADEIDHIFDPFYTTKGEQGGTGLGLSIAYGIIRQHDGTIDVDSKPGRGTTVSVTLPAARDESND